MNRRGRIGTTSIKMKTLIEIDFQQAADAAVQASLGLRAERKKGRPTEWSWKFSLCFARFLNALTIVQGVIQYLSRPMASKKKPVPF